MTARYLVLETGQVFTGVAFGAAQAAVTGELVFTTGMTGYQESLTDPSFCGQLIMFTYPLIGNCGINRDDSEAIDPTCAGVVVREVARLASNWRQRQPLADFLRQKEIPGISEVDTRELTKLIRQAGTLKARLVDELPTPAQIEAISATPLARNQVAQVATTKAYPSPGKGYNIAVIDFGLKHSILRQLAARDCDVIVLPATTTAAELLALAPDGVLLSNGPGDPQDVPAALPLIRGIQGKIPLMGICLGHQLFALANGATTFKMKFGHRGGNHPVREIATGRIDFTSQNHGFAVDPASLAGTDLLVTHEELNDQTIEGLRHRRYPAFSVQFHPDATPGPHDATHLFDEFIEMITATKRA
ncbi:carbamoyl phosphate synthase small subunit [Lapidilactobacillus achengensis]|uniref:Carbamoyl phosphate synthase small chain n=1 Tax=Lapidilactobacillus achengensis TaxID=2486000 RepID=A0ABW1UP48_9LACO|nr:carbamoyl phosphate synthase small subunit [Lapidilactobacillus achengensis]